MSLHAAALIPAAPVLIPELTGQVPVAQEVRAAALASIRIVLDSGIDELVIVGSGEPTGWHSPDRPLRLDRLGGIDMDDGPGEPIPVPLAIGAALARGAGWHGPVRLLTVEADVPSLDASARSGLLAVGNGSARCTPKAPGSFDDGSAAFNEGLLSMIVDADLAAMSEFDVAAAAHQWSDCAGPLRALGTWMAPGAGSQIAYAQEWGGVYYVCAAFTSA